MPSFSTAQHSSVSNTTASTSCRPGGLLTMCACVVSTLLGLGDVVAGPLGGTARSGAASNTVEGEIGRRQRQILEAEALVGEGDALATEKKYAEAVAKYAEAYNSIIPSPMSEKVHGMARERYSAASVLHARKLISAAEFDEAEAVVDRVLAPTVSPDYKPALEVKARLQDPEWYNRARTPKHDANVAAVEKGLRMGAGAYELGDFDLALKHYAGVLRIDRYNMAARRGMQEAETAIMRYQRSARDQTRTRMLRKVDEQWETPVAADLSGAFGLGDGEFLGAGSTSLEKKLSSIVLDVVQFDEAGLDEVVEYLVLRSRALDPSGTGVNIVLSLDPDDQFAPNANVSLTLRNIPMLEVLKYVTRDTRTDYRIDGYSVRIVSAASSSDSIVTKRFRVPPDFLSSAAVDSGGGADDPFGDPNAGGGGGLILKRVTAKEFLMQQGVTFPPGSSANFIPRTSTLLVSNTANNLDLVQAFIDSSFESVAKQVEIHVTMMDIGTNELSELGFDWLINQFNVPGSARTFGGGGTLGNSPISGAASQTADYTFIPPGGDTPLGQFPLTSGLRTGNAWRNADNINGILLGGAGTVAGGASSFRAPGVFGVGGAFTDPQFQTILRGLSQSKNSDIISRPSVVTRSGQRAVVEAVREFPFPTEYDPPEIPQDIGFGASSGNFPVTPAHPTAFEVRKLGALLEVEPVVGADNFTVELNLSPEYVQFEGFIDYGSPISTSSTNLLGATQSVELTDNQILQPVFKTIKESTSVVVWDGATVAIGGLVEDRIQHVEDRVPGLSAIPLLGRTFKSKGEDRTTRVVMFFVKVNIIDPSGARINQRQ